MSLSEEELERYRRHILLPEIGIEGQDRIKEARVLIIGLGGLGSPAALYLAAAGVGSLGLIDGDCVDRSNLQRQIIHATEDIYHPKVVSAAGKIASLNPNVKVEAFQEFLTDDNAERIISKYDFIIDATDSFGSKLLINDTCVRLGKPYSHGGLSRYQGQTMTVLPGTACYRCLIDSAPEHEDPAGPLGVVPGILGTLQAAEALKYITQTGELLTNRLLMFDALTMQFNTFTVKISASCPNHINE